MKYDFNNSEHFKALERQAYDGTIDVSGFPPAAYRYFDSLRLLYARFKYDGLSKAQAEDEKRNLLAQYKEAVSVRDQVVAFLKLYQDNTRAAGTLLSEIEKLLPLPETMAEFYQRKGFKGHRGNWI